MNILDLKTEEFIKLSLENLEYKTVNINLLKETSLKINGQELYYKTLFTNGLSDWRKEVQLYFLKLYQDKHILKSDKISQNITDALNIYFQILSPYKTALKKIAAFDVSFGNFTNTHKLHFKSASYIWYHINDKSTDFNYYSKRLILTGILETCQLYWLKDESANYIDTKKFIDKQIANVMIIGKIKNKIKQKF